MFFEGSRSYRLHHTKIRATFLVSKGCVSECTYDNETCAVQTLSHTRLHVEHLTTYTRYVAFDNFIFDMCSQPFTFKNLSFAQPFQSLSTMSAAASTDAATTASGATELIIDGLGRPPYDEDTVIGDGVSCYKCTVYNATSWVNLHLRQRCLTAKQRPLPGVYACSIATRDISDTMTSGYMKRINSCIDWCLDMSAW